jgi:hypothetical protein
MSTLSVPPPCPHHTTYRLSSRPLHFLHCCLRVRPLGRREIQRDPRELPRRSPCAVASPSPTSRLYACLICDRALPRVVITCCNFGISRFVNISVPSILNGQIIGISQFVHMSSDFSIST